jgi:CheY-like chemotaxis protein
MGVPENTIETLLTALRDPDGLVRQKAAAALENLGWKPRTPLHGALYLIAKREWRRCLQLGAPAVEPLVAVLTDADSDVRQAAAATLDRLGWEPETALRGTRYLIAKRDWRTCIRAGRAMVGPLIAVLEDADAGVRQGAARALGHIGDVRAVEPLVALLKDTISEVRRAADEGIKQINAARPGDVAEVLKRSAVPQATAVLKRLRGKGLVVCIDDDQLMADSFRHFLELEGYYMFHETNGAKGLACVRHVRPDVVLLDLNVPIMHGWQVLERIKTDNTLKHIPVLIVSAGVPHSPKGMDLRADNWLPKPVTQPELIEAIEQALKGKEWD